MKVMQGTSETFKGASRTGLSLTAGVKPGQANSPFPTAKEFSIEGSGAIVDPKTGRSVMANAWIRVWGPEAALLLQVQGTGSWLNQSGAPHDIEVADSQGRFVVTSDGDPTLHVSVPGSQPKPTFDVPLQLLDAFD